MCQLSLTIHYCVALVGTGHIFAIRERRKTDIQTVSLSFFRFSNSLDRLWAFAMMGIARSHMRRLRDVGFWKLCGSGTGEGFTPLPNTGVYAILATWPDEGTARRQTGDAPIFRLYRNRASECWTVFLVPVSVRGQWSGVNPFEPVADAGPAFIAALTRATVKPASALKFWRKVPNISSIIGQDENVIFKIGIGEMPFLHQITFSIWPDTAAMEAFARVDGPHARAIAAVRRGKWFSEELYARFHVLGDSGTWNDISPLAARTAVT